RCSSIAFLRLVGPGTPYLLCRHGAAALPPGCAPLIDPSDCTAGVLDPARRCGGGLLDLVGVHPCLPSAPSPAPSGTAGRARSVPPPGAAHVARGQPVRLAGLGGERGGEGRQRPGGGPGTAGGRRRAAAPDSGLPPQ